MNEKKFELGDMVLFAGEYANGYPYFIARHICEALDIKNVSMAVSKLDEDEKGIILTDTPGGVQNVSVVNESGLYSLIMSSRKKVAKVFRKWVTSEVLPAVRKHGAYMTPEKAQEILDSPDTAVILAEGLLKERKERLEATEKATVLLEEKNALTEDKKELSEELVLKENTIYHQNNKIEHLKVSDEYLRDNVLPSQSLISSTELGTMVGMGATKLHRWLAGKGVLRWVNERYVLTAKYAPEGYTKDVSYTYLHSDGVTKGTSRRIMWTEGGVMFVKTLYNLLENKEQPDLL